MCGLGFFFGGYFGSKIAIKMDSRDLQGAFGSFLIVAAILLWWRSRPQPLEKKSDA
jgi:uncharacterized membrane protein YfcA